jgi:hypothetical protein
LKNEEGALTAENAAENIHFFAMALKNALMRVPFLI